MIPNLDSPSSNIQVLCGPILRRVTQTSVTLTITASHISDLKIELLPNGEAPLILENAFLSQFVETIEIAPSVIHYLIYIPNLPTLPVERWIGYEIYLKHESDAKWLKLSELIPNALLNNRSSLGFVIKENHSKILHGSCRKPHFRGGDGLTRAEEMLQSSSLENWPSVLMLSGDQVYVDDVAGPMLAAIHELIHQLNMPVEQFEGSVVTSSEDIHKKQPHYYKREDLLPKDDTSSEARKALFTSVKKPIFTSAHARNHLISLSEMICMYLLSWSPECWSFVSMRLPEGLSDKDKVIFDLEKQTILSFQKDLIKVRRVLAHLPTAMIFDDHDITDDWNLSSAWEIAAYQQEFSKRIIGNALIAYLIFQGWGNNPTQFSTELIEKTKHVLEKPIAIQQNELIDKLLSYSQWHYEWPGSPALIVLDTRTHRWRSEVKVTNPSGLMDWESLTDLQQKLLGKDAVILVSAAPIFGVKFIEGIQKVFTVLGQPLLVDAENWMAHKGAANVLLNMFRHSKTPKNFTVLSGDVHYSFAYQVRLRDQSDSPQIFQITSSGIRNEFPEKLLKIFDRIDRWLYAPWSPLNWFTKRRQMRITPYRPSIGEPGRRLINASGIGMVEFDDEGTPIRISQICANGKSIDFTLDKRHVR